MSYYDSLHSKLTELTRQLNQKDTELDQQLDELDRDTEAAEKGLELYVFGLKNKKGMGLFHFYYHQY
jgi:uncharacterized protein involved in exopolysaccharide biosynthesis